MEINKDDTLFNYLAKIQGDRLFLVSDSEAITFRELVEYTSEFIESYSQYKGSNIAVRFENRMLAVKNLPAISELAQLLLVLPDGLDKLTIQDFFFKARINYYIEFHSSGLVIHNIAEFVEKNNDDNGSWVLATSGTTGTPKLVSYRLGQLIGTSKKDCSKGLNYRWALVYDVNRFAGLQVYFQALLSGSQLTVIESGDNLDCMILKCLKSNVNSISATPSFFRKLFMSNRSAEINFARLTLGGEIADQTLLNGLSKRYPLAKINHIYASTEAGVGFSVKDRKEGFPISYLNKDNDSKLPALKIEDGRLWIKSEHSSKRTLSGYFEVDEQGYINTGDLVIVNDDRVLFLGRESGTINVGGNKVIPEEVERVLLMHQSVSECHVFGKKNAMMGMLVCCDLILNENTQPNSEIKKVLQAHCKKHLETFKIPVLINIVNNIEKNAVGKIMRRKTQ